MILRNIIRGMLHCLGPQIQTRLGCALLWRAVKRAGGGELSKLIPKLDGLALEVEDLKRKLDHPVKAVPNCHSQAVDESLTYQVLPDAPPWSTIHVDHVPIPGMLTREEIQYYYYVSRFYSGAGEVVGLGSWLGLSTHHLVRALSGNPLFQGKKLHVFDDFVWRSDWMDPCFDTGSQPAHHQDFLPLFEKYASPIRQHLQVTKG
jgi:hypothetical protein